MRQYKIRIIDKEYSKSVQEKLFELGYLWELYGKSVTFSSKPFLFADTTGRIAYDVEESYFLSLDAYEEVTLLNLIQDGLIKPKPDLKSISEIPSHYDNSLCSLYKIAEERKWSPYLFDIVKRLERANKKGEFKSDLDKSKVVIDIWKKENNQKLKLD